MDPDEIMPMSEAELDRIERDVLKVDTAPAGPLTPDRRAVSDNDVFALIRDLRVARRELAEVIGFDPSQGENAGPFTHCGDCKRRMVYDRLPGTQGPGSVWMCPRCVKERLKVADRELAEAVALLIYAREKGIDPAYIAKRNAFLARHEKEDAK